MSRTGQGLWPAIDWGRPWMALLAGLGAEAERRIREGESVAGALNALTAGAAPGVRFVPQDDLPPGMAYEQFIFDTGAVPTRDNLHDLLNGLCWWTFPATKRCLNRLQAAELARMGVQAVRGPVRDALTLFDENAALLQAPDALWDALQARDWTRLFVDLRPLWAQARLVLFGHALVEKLVSPYKAITAHVFIARVPHDLADDWATWDRWLAGQLQPGGLAGKPFTPLPVLGVPGWWAANETPAFYDDTQVFRPPAPGRLQRPSNLACHR